MIYNRLALVRTDAKISRQELAEKVGVNYQTIGFIERGDYSPSLDLAFAISRVFGVGVEDIFADTEFKSIFSERS
jgi:DNA-binding XRE family transcriptional regulator